MRKYIIEILFSVGKIIFEVFYALLLILFIMLETLSLYDNTSHAELPLGVSLLIVIGFILQHKARNTILQVITCLISMSPFVYALIAVREYHLHYGKIVINSGNAGAQVFKIVFITLLSVTPFVKGIRSIQSHFKKHASIQSSSTGTKNLTGDGSLERNRDNY